MGLHDRWTDEEDIVLREAWPLMTAREITALIPSRTPQGIASRARRLSLDAGLRIGASRMWTAQEDERLRRMDSMGVGIDDMAAHLDRTREAIKQRRYSLGLSRFIPRLTTQQVETIRGIILAGKPMGIAAKAAGCSRNGVRRVCQRLGVSNGLKPGRQRLDESWGWDECGRKPVEKSA